MKEDVTVLYFMFVGLFLVVGILVFNQHKHKIPAPVYISGFNIDTGKPNGEMVFFGDSHAAGFAKAGAKHLAEFYPGGTRVLAFNGYSARALLGYTTLIDGPANILVSAGTADLNLGKDTEYITFLLQRLLDDGHKVTWLKPWAHIDAGWPLNNTADDVVVPEGCAVLEWIPDARFRRDYVHMNRDGYRELLTRISELKVKGDGETCDGATGNFSTSTGRANTSLNTNTVQTSRT